MTEITLDVDLRHPRERVWRALTDRSLLDQWFMRSDQRPSEASTFTGYPEGIEGFTGPIEVDLIEVSAPELLRMRMRGEQLHADLRWELVEQPGGCRLRVSQSGFMGVDGEQRRREVHRSYQQIFAEALPAILDRMAGGAAGTGEPPRQQHVTPPPRVAAVPYDEPEPMYRRRRALAFLVTSLMIVALVGWLWATRPRAADPVGWGPDGIGTPRVPGMAQQPGGEPDPSPSPTPAPTGGSAVPRPGSSAAPGGGATPSPGPTTGTPSPTAVPPVPLTARYTTKTEHGLLGVGYLAKVTTTVRNPGTSAHDGWKVVMTIPKGAEVSNKSPDLVGVSVSGATVTITPIGSARTVGGGTDVVFTFHFSGGSLLGLGTGTVTSCKIDGAAC